MSNNPDISIILPIWNTEIYLEECLDSIVSQTLSNIEIICIDDNSIDNSFQILKKYQAQDSRFLILKNTALIKGSATARNLGLNHAQGRYIQFIDADDLLPSNDVLSRMLYYAEKYDSDETIGKVQRWYFQEDGRMEEGYHSIYQNEGFYNKTIKESPQIFRQVVVWNKLYKRSFLQEHQFIFNVNIRGGGEDLPFSIKAHYLATNITLIDELCYTHRIRNRNNFSQVHTLKKTCSKDKCHIYEELFNFFKRNYDAEKVNLFFHTNPYGIATKINKSFLELNTLDLNKYIFLDRIRHWMTIFDILPKQETKQLAKNMLVKYLLKDDMKSIVRFLELIFSRCLKPAVSIIVPISNVSRNVRDLISNIHNQYNQDFEIIFIDNCFNKKVIQAVNNLIANDYRYYLIKKMESAGLQKIGLKYAAGKKILFYEAGNFTVVS